MGLAAVWLANTYFGALEQQASNPTGTPQGTVKILAAKQDLAFGDTITADAVQLVDWPATSVPQGAIAEAEAQGFIGQNNAAVRSVVAGEPILQSRASTRSLLSASIPADQRAVSIPVDAVTGAPVTLKQQMDDGTPMTASANKIDYDLKTEVVVFTGKVDIQQPRGNLSGERVVYNMRTQQVTGGGQGAGRVKMRIMPKGARPSGSGT